MCTSFLVGLMRSKVTERGSTKGGIRAGDVVVLSTLRRSDLLNRLTVPLLTATDKIVSEVADTAEQGSTRDEEAEVRKTL